MSRCITFACQNLICQAKRTLGLNMREHLDFATANVNVFVISIPVIENVPLDEWLQKRDNFLTILNTFLTIFFNYLFLFECPGV
jgi:hypothetical protein